MIGSSVLFTTTIPIGRISFQLFTIYRLMSIFEFVLNDVRGNLNDPNSLKKITVINVDD